MQSQAKGSTELKDFKQQRLDYKDFTSQTLIDTNFAGASLRNALFVKTDLRRANLSRLQTGETREGPVYTSIDLSEANFNSACLDAGYLIGAVVNNTSFENATFRRTSIGEIKWNNSINLLGADMREALFCTYNDEQA